MINIKEKIASEKRNIVLIGIILIFSVLVSLKSPEFISFNNIMNILNNNSAMGILALGMTIAIATGSIDVSIGAQFAIVSIVVGFMASYLDSLGIESNLIIFCIAIMTGIVLSIINGVIISLIELPAVIITLGTMSIMRGLLLFFTNGSWIPSIPKWFAEISRFKILGIHFSSIIWIVLIFLIGILFKYTYLGKNILAFGDNQEAAIRTGIKPIKIYVVSFLIYGIMTGIGSTIFVSQIGSAQPTVGIGYEMILVSAVIIGGNKITGGMMNILGTGLGILLLGLIDNAMIFMQVPVYLQDFITGILIILAILSAYKSKKNN